MAENTYDKIKKVYDGYLVHVLVSFLRAMRKIKFSSNLGIGLDSED